MPCASAAAMTSSSRFEPPGWMAAGGPRGGHAAVGEQAKRPLAGNRGALLVARLRRDDHLEDELRHLRGARRVERAVDRDDAAEGADGIAGERLLIGRGEAGAGG